MNIAPLSLSTSLALRRILRLAEACIFRELLLFSSLIVSKNLQLESQWRFWVHGSKFDHVNQP